MRPLFCSLLATFITSSTLLAQTDVWIAGQGGIHHTQLDENSGQLSDPELAATFGSGSWLEFHPTQSIIYSSLRENGGSGLIAFAIESSGNLVELDRLILPMSAPSHFSITPDGAHLATAHYGGKSTVLVSLQPDGKFGSDPFVFEHEGSGPKPQQTQARPHWAGFTGDGRHLHVADLGTDEIWTFAVKPSANELELIGQLGVPEGMGPRHMAFSADESRAVVSQELEHHLTLLRFDGATGAFDILQHIDAAPADLDERRNNVSEIRIHPNGKFVYIGNRGHDSIGVFAFNADQTELTLVEHEPVRGVWPRNFRLNDTGTLLLAAGQYSNSLASFGVNPASGELQFNGNIIAVPAPVRVLIGRP